MSSNLRVLASVTLVATMVGVVSCGREETPAPRPPGTTAGPPPAPATTQMPPGHPPVAPAAADSTTTAAPRPMEEVDVSGVTMTDKTVMLTGISFSLPEGWVREDPGMNPQSPGLSRKAQFRLPKTDNDAEDAKVAITHFPNMKGMDEANLQRWYGQFSQPDGGSTAAVSTRAEFALGDVSVILVDIPGTMRASPMMGGSGAAKPGQRMLAAVVNHAKGPHFVKITGPSAVIERWKPSAVAFLKSVRVNQ